MSKINTDYSYLFELMFGVKNSKSSSKGIVNSFKVSDISSSSVQAQLRAAGVNTNSKQYKAVISEMMKSTGGAAGAMFTNVQAIKNLMKNYNSDGDFTAGGLVIPGMLVNGIPESERHQIIDISEDARQKMFENCKREFIAENGVANGDTTKRSDVFRAFQLSIKKEDRLKGTWTLEQYERQYNKAFYEAVKAADPSWKPGKRLPAGVLDGITRESIDKSLVKTQGQYGETFTRGINTSV